MTTSYLSVDIYSNQKPKMQTQAVYFSLIQRELTNKHHVKQICDLIVNMIYYGRHSKFLCIYILYTVTDFPNKITSYTVQLQLYLKDMFYLPNK